MKSRNCRARLGWEACFVAGLKNYPLAGHAWRPFKIIYAASYADVRPTFAVDITKQFEGRRRAILAYESQFRPTKKERSRVAIPLDDLEDILIQADLAAGQRSPGRASASRRCLPPRRRRAHYSYHAFR